MCMCVCVHIYMMYTSISTRASILNAVMLFLCKTSEIKRKNIINVYKYINYTICLLLLLISEVLQRKGITTLRMPAPLKMKHKQTKEISFSKAHFILR